MMREQVMAQLAKSSIKCLLQQLTDKSRWQKEMPIELLINP
jgi:hypothetical protein